MLVCSTQIYILIAVERYTVLCHPLRSLGWWTRKKVFILLTIIWAISVCICVPYGYATRYRQHPFNNVTGTYCYYAWNNGWLTSYETALICVFFFVPVPLLIAMYGKMIIALKSKVPHAENPSTSSNQAKSRARVVSMLAILIMIFLVCLLPSKIYAMVYFHVPRYAAVLGSRFDVIFNWTGGLLMYVNHACNPVVYFLMSDNFREAFCHLFLAANVLKLCS